MYVCLCNALTERDVREAIEEGARRPAEIFAKCDVAECCAACCGTMCRMVREKMVADRAEEPVYAEAAE